ncbi:MAG: GGGtGRT protein [Christensenellaceae bacterium]
MRRSLLKGLQRRRAAAAIGIGLQAFCIPGSVAQNRQVGLGHGNLGAMLLSDETECFCFLAGHESFAAAEGAFYRSKRKQSQKEPLESYFERLGQGCRVYHFENQRLHFCGNGI